MTELGSYVVVTPVKNEIESLGAMVKSVLGQTVRPALWVLIDDGSTDGSQTALADLAADHDWVRVLESPDEGDPQLGAHIVDLLERALEACSQSDWQYWAKVDADVVLDPSYFERLLEDFTSDPQLGIASGKAQLVVGSGNVRPEWTPDHFPLGMARLYRRECWESLGEPLRARMFDVYDVYVALMNGWKTWRDPGVIASLLRPVDGRMPNRLSRRFEAGEWHFRLGYHPVYFAFRCLRASLDDPPRILSGVAMFLGFVWACLRRQKRVGKELRTFVRNQQAGLITFGSLKKYFSERSG